MHQILQSALHKAVSHVIPDVPLEKILVQPCPDPRFGDYQTNALMGLARARKMNPRQLAADVIAQLELDDCCESVEVAGGGFINFRLRPEAIVQTLEQAANGKHLFHKTAAQPRTVVVDFSSPNVAKPMHVGHIRSTILGDCLARTLRLLGHRVITDNHIGDWGTQFGKLIVGWKKHLDREAVETHPLAEMERLYRQVNADCEVDPSLLDEARQELVKLQSGDSENVAIWEEMIRDSRQEFDTIYQRRGITFDHTLGESFYNPRLTGVVDNLIQRGLAQSSDGAMVVFFEDDPQLKNHPAIVRKSDGAANYTTTDLATLEHRLNEWSPDEIVYVTDGRQQLHFRQLFAIFNRWHPEAKVCLAHVWFGSIMGEDGKPFKTRSGDTVKLADLLDEAESRAFQVVTEKNPDLPEPQRREIARVVGLGAIKYADLSPNRQSDYIFSWDKMLAFNGNTAPYLQYAYTRIRSIFRKDQTASGAPDNAPVEGLSLEDSEELKLAKQLMQFGLVLERVAAEYRPNYLCTYLYELAQQFARFYEQCPVLKSEGVQRRTRVTLCDLTARVLRQGLEVLGIEVAEQM